MGTVTIHNSSARLLQFPLGATQEGGNKFDRVDLKPLDNELESSQWDKVKRHKVAGKIAQAYLDDGTLTVLSEDQTEAAAAAEEKGEPAPHVATLARTGKKKSKKKAKKKAAGRGG